MPSIGKRKKRKFSIVSLQGCCFAKKAIFGIAGRSFVNAKALFVKTEGSFTSYRDSIINPRSNIVSNDARFVNANASIVNDSGSFLSANAITETAIGNIVNARPGFVNANASIVNDGGSFRSDGGNIASYDGSIISDDERAGLG